MKNQDRPANPVRFDHQTPGQYEPDEETGGKYPLTGLTKLEYAAIAAMQGLLTNRYAYRESAPILAELSVKQAKALLAELDKEGE